MLQDSLIIVAVVLVLVIIITMFGGCISCGNNGYSHEGMVQASTTSSSPLMDNRTSVAAPVPIVTMPPSDNAPPSMSSSGTVVGGAPQGYDTSGDEYASFRPLSS